MNILLHASMNKYNIINSKNKSKYNKMIEIGLKYGSSYVYIKTLKRCIKHNDHDKFVEVELLGLEYGDSNVLQYILDYGVSFFSSYNQSNLYKKIFLSFNQTWWFIMNIKKKI